ncbi:MAG: hypothetical protein ACXWNI_07715, partial [Candidatus Limnocylindrales bacterium]
MPPASARASAPASTAASVPASGLDAAPPNGDEGVVRLAVTEAGVLHEWDGKAALAELPRALARRRATLWIDVMGADSALKVRVADIIGLHPLLVEDIC